MPETDPAQQSQVEDVTAEADVHDFLKAVSLQLGKTISEAQIKALGEILLRQESAVSHLESEAQIKALGEILLRQESAVSHWESVELDLARNKALVDLLDVGQVGRARFIVQGSGGVGKTALLQNLHQTYRLVERGSFVGASPEALELELEAHEEEFSELLEQLDASEAESSQRQAVIAELRQSADTALSDLAEVVAAL